MTATEEFLKYLQAEKRYAGHTIKAYKTVLNQFHAFCCENGKEGMDLHFRTIRSWVVSQMDSGIAPRTVNKKLAALSTYCKYLIREGNLDSNPVDGVLKPKMKKRNPVFVEKQKMEDLLDEDSFGDDFEGVRNRLIIDLLYQTGMRRSELIGLKAWSVDRKGRSVKVLGKRNKERIVPLNDVLIEAVDGYLSIRAGVVTDPGVDALIVTARGAPAYDSMIYRIVRKYLSMVTTLDKKSPHVLRHTFATHMLNNGADLNAIKELLGHANLSATQVYTHNTFEKLKSIYNQAHPRAEK
ncbi:MAG: tyrosine-type recombinase/integrase [Bacteroidetes bacterium]|nr:tyrosine-type recombinase/integrase [Bacteroidota bacterium]